MVITDVIIANSPLVKAVSFTAVQYPRGYYDGNAWSVGVECITGDLSCKDKLYTCESQLNHLQVY